MELQVGRSGRLLEVRPGSTITNGVSAIRLTDQVPPEGRWGIAGWSGASIVIEPYGGQTGGLVFLPDYLVRTWRHVPWEWSPSVVRGFAERYRWTPGCRSLVREVRQELAEIGA